MSQVLQAEVVVHRITSGWRAAPPVTVVGRTADLPARAPDDVRGMLRFGQAFIVAGTQPLSGVGDTLAHEAIGHHAVRETLGRHWRGFMFGVQSGARRGDWRLRCFRDEVRGAYTDESGACNLSPVSESDEITAAVAESRFNSASGRIRVQQPMRKIMQATAGHISREVLYQDKPVDFDQLLGTILVAEHRLRYGGPFWGLGNRLWKCYDEVMAKPWNPRNPPMSLDESQRLLDAEAGRIRSRSRMLGDLMGIGFLLWVMIVWAIKLGLAFLVLRFLWRHLV